MSEAKSIEIALAIYEEDADDERLDELTVSLMKRLREFELDSIERPVDESSSTGARGDAFTIGALILAVAPAVLPSLIEFLDTYVGERQRIEVESGSKKVSFVPDRHYTEEEVLALVRQLDQV